MVLTVENKSIIDGMSYEQLLRGWRQAPVLDPWFLGDTGRYWWDRMAALEKENPEITSHVQKTIGWAL